MRRFGSFVLCLTIGPKVRTRKSQSLLVRGVQNSRTNFSVVECHSVIFRILLPHRNLRSIAKDGWIAV